MCVVCDTGRSYGPMHGGMGLCAAISVALVQKDPSTVFYGRIPASVRYPVVCYYAIVGTQSIKWYFQKGTLCT